ncbi:hypothetical protein [Roseomonas chloroacetimidivorans]|jgi:hypothetical protein|uniref:hypothetical protein n=1 Tax=Roseomonas chloroacetimidivorans TaxID=1766656 RepID=UPI003C721701
MTRALTYLGVAARFAWHGRCVLAGHHWQSDGWKSLPYGEGRQMRLMLCTRCKEQRTDLAFLGAYQAPTGAGWLTRAQPRKIKHQDEIAPEFADRAAMHR